MSGVFIVFEGGEGAGKSTHAKRLASALAQRGLIVVLTREPGGTPIGEAIRDVLLGQGSHGMANITEALLFAAARAQHSAELIRPALAKGAIVVSDRYIDSSVAYQGAARGLGEDRVESLSGWATDDLLPDLTIVLDVAAEVGLQRAGEGNRMEREPLAFHQAVRESLLRRAAHAPDRYLVLNSTLGRDDVAGAILDRVQHLLPPRQK